MVSENQPTGAQAISRAFELFEVIVQDSGETSLRELGERLSLAGSTSRRYAKLLLERGLIVRIARGRYAGSQHLRRLLDGINPLSRLIAVARPILAAAASRENATAHLGTYENEMVTYLVREGLPSIFTREHAQLEAYCTGIGKALLSQLSLRDLDAYLRLPMVKLTPTTIVDPEVMRSEVEAIRQRGYAIDDGEMQAGLVCIAAPLGVIEGQNCAVSFSYPGQKLERMDIERISARLLKCADQIASRMAAKTPVSPAEPHHRHIAAGP